MDQKGEGGIRGEGSISEARGHFDIGGAESEEAGGGGGSELLLLGPCALPCVY